MNKSYQTSTLIANNFAKPYSDETICTGDQSELFAPSIGEATLVQQAHRDGFRGFATINHKNGPKARLHEIRFPVAQLGRFITDALKHKRDDHDLYIAQHSYLTPKRATTSLLSLNSVHIDCDVYNTKWLGFPVAFIVEAILKKLQEHQVSLPTYIVSSGRGLYVKWILDTPLSPLALPRWQVLHRWICEEVLSDFGADIKATLPTQILRIVGSRNLKGGEVGIAWVNGGDIDCPQMINFETLAAQVLKYSRAECKEFQARMSQYKDWDRQNAENLAKLAKLTPDQARAGRAKAWETVGKAIGMHLDPATLSSMDDLMGGEIWTRRIGTAQRLIALRGHSAGIPDGSKRHEFLWMAANGYAWVNRNQPTVIKKDIQAWSDAHTPSFSAQERDSHVAGILVRAKQEQGWGSGLYRMAETTFRERLAITEAELEALARHKNAARESWNVGVMGFEPMQGLRFDEYCVKTTYRKSMAGQEIGVVNLRNASMAKVQANEEKRAKALRMASEGCKQAQIATVLGVGQGTVSKWLKAGF